MPLFEVSISTILVVRIREFEEVAAFLPQVEEAVSDVSKFSSVSVYIHLVRVFYIHLVRVLYIHLV